MSHLKLLKDLKRYSLELSRPHPANVTTVGCSMDSSGRQTGRMESVSQHFSNISVFKQSRVPPEGLDEIFYQMNAHALGSFFFFCPSDKIKRKWVKVRRGLIGTKGGTRGLKCYFRYSGKKKKN